MNILHIINDLGAGGAQRVLHNITKKESNNSHVIFVLSGTGYYSKFWDSSNLTIFYFNMNSFNFIFALTSIHRIVKKHQIDVIQTWLYISDLVGIIYSLFNPKIKLFWNIRNGLVNSKVLSLASLFAVKICSFLSFLPTKIICVSKKSIAYHHGLGYSLKKFVLIHNIVDTDIFKPQNGAEFSENMRSVKFGVVARFDIQKGHENLFKALNLGIFSAVGSTYNYMNPLYLSMIEDFKAGNKEAAENKQQKCNDIITSLFENGGPMIAGKAIMKWTGVDCGPCRLPLTNLSEKSISKLNEVLKAKGFFNLNP